MLVTSNEKISTVTIQKVTSYTDKSRLSSSSHSATVYCLLSNLTKRTPSIQVLVGIAA
jgi:hypothetical protein